MVFLLFFIFPFLAHSQDWGIWHQAKVYYDQKSYSQALEELLKNPLSSPNYFFNLGIISYHLGELGKARAYLEKASSLKSQDLDIKKNLSLIQFQWEEKYGNLDQSTSTLEAFFEKFIFMDPRNFIGLITFIFLLLGFKLYAKTRKAYLLTKKLWLIFLFLITGINFIFEFFLIQKIAPPALTLYDQIIRSGPGEDYMELAQLPAGSKVRCLNKNYSWIQIRYSQKNIGWIPYNTLLTL